MCIVIDVNVLSMVFNEDNARHADYSPVKKWIEDGKGFLVFGGSKYKKELGYRSIRLVNKMRDAGQAIAINDSAVDRTEKKVRQLTDNTDCDDQHIIALLGAANCPLLCSFDSRSFEFIKNRGLYPDGVAQVKIYKSSRNADLLKKSDPKKLRNVVG